MVALAWCFLLLLLLGIEWGIFGVLACKLFRLELKSYETGIVGFFVYFGLFQVVALPLILIQRPFHELVWLWLVALGIVNLFVLFTARGLLGTLVRNILAGLWRIKGLLFAVVFLLVLFVCWFQGTQQYMGWDTTYYIGTIDTTVYTDSMYQYNGASGVAEQVLDLRYALSAFYMHSAVLCKLTAVSGVMVQKYVLGTVCILLHGLILFAMGRRLFPDSERKALVLIGLVFVMHLGFQTMYSVSDFLVIRGYEAKGFCANVIIPAVFYAALRIWEQSQNREAWAIMFFVCLSSVPVSMSSLLIVPAMVVIVSMAEAMARKSWTILGRGICCAVPNSIYLLVYFLYTRGLEIFIHQ